MLANRVERILPEDLDKGLKARWTQVQRADTAQRSPFFSLGFLQAVARHRPDLEIGILWQGQRICGFFPFHRRPGGRGVPLAGPIADYQGIVGSAGGLSAQDLLSGCGLTHYDYDHGLRGSPLMAWSAFRHTGSPLIELSAGHDAWYDARRTATSAIKTTERKMRKLTRDIGPLRFTAHDTAPDAWDSLIAWKRAALGGKGVRLILDTPWVRDVTRDIHDTDGPAFAGRMSTLRAGDRLVAVHFGMRSDAAWHWWFPAYDPAVSACSPGLGLLMMCAQQAARDGMAELDLGRGTERYKREFASATRPLCEGSLERVLAPQGAARRLRKLLHGVARDMLPERHLDLKRRAFNRLLGAGRM